jgi:hypothetical protein
MRRTLTPFIYSLLIALTTSIEFEVLIPSGRTECLREVITSGTNVTGHVYSPGIIDSSFTSAEGQVYFLKSEMRNDFSLTVEGDGLHVLCMSNNDDSIAQFVEVALEVGVHSPDLSEAARHKTLKPLEYDITLLDQLADELTGISRSMIQREETLIARQDDITLKLMTFSVSVVVVLIFLAIFQSLFFRGALLAKKSS